MAKRKRPIQGVQRRYSWRLYPTPEQEEMLHDQAGLCVDLWNSLLETVETINRRCVQRQVFQRWRDADGVEWNFPSPRCKEQSDALKKAGWSLVSTSKTGFSYHGRRAPGWKMGDSGPKRLRRRDLGTHEHRNPREFPSEYDMGSWIKAVRDECPEWRVMSSCTPPRVVNSFVMAWKAFFSGMRGYPRYKSRKRDLNIPHQVYNPECRRKGSQRYGQPTGSGCLIKKGNMHRSWWVYLKGVKNDIYARREMPAKGTKPLSIHEWTYADVIFRQGKWEISAAMDIDRRRRSADELIPVTVNFDLLDGFAQVNGKLVTPDGFTQIEKLEEQKDAMKSDFDRRWPRPRPFEKRKRLPAQEWKQQCDAKRALSTLSSHIARVRANTLHVWTKRLVEQVSEITIIKLAVKDNTESPRGNKDDWGAVVELVSAFNRKALSYAPGMAAAMLEYKANEIGIPCRVIKDDAPNATIGKKTVASTKAIRKMNRNLKQQEKAA